MPHMLCHFCLFYLPFVLPKVEHGTCLQCIPLQTSAALNWPAMVGFLGEDLGRRDALVEPVALECAEETLC